MDPADAEAMKLIESLQIKLIKEDSSEIVSRHIIRKIQGKFSFTVDDSAYYKICAQNVSYHAFGKRKVYMKLVIESENSDEKNLDEAVRHHDVNPVVEKIERIISKSKAITEAQKLEIELEDQFSTIQMKYSSNFITFAVVQVIGVLLVGIYHIFSFRKFLISNRIIESD